MVGYCNLQKKLNPRKLTYPLKNDYFSREYIFKFIWSIDFQGTAVSFQGSTSPKFGLNAPMVQTLMCCLLHQENLCPMSTAHFCPKQPPTEHPIRYTYINRVIRYCICLLHLSWNEIFFKIWDYMLLFQRFGIEFHVFVCHTKRDKWCIYIAHWIQVTNDDVDGCCSTASLW